MAVAKAARAGGLQLGRALPAATMKWCAVWGGVSEGGEGENTGELLKREM